MHKNLFSLTNTYTFHNAVEHLQEKKHLYHRQVHLLPEKIELIKSQLYRHRHVHYMDAQFCLFGLTTVAWNN